MRVLQAVEEVNEKQKSILFEKLQRHFNGDLRDKTIALWGLAFKPETDDMREAPSLILIDKLLNAGCKVRVYDPAAMTECRRRIGDSCAGCRCTDAGDRMERIPPAVMGRYQKSHENPGVTGRS